MTATTAASPQQTQQASTYRKRTWAWAMYDWANSSVVTVIVAAVFPIYYNSIAQAELGGAAASAFSFAITISLLLSAFAGPIVGTLGDVIGGLKRLLIVATVLGAISVIAMYTLRSPVCVSNPLGDMIDFCPLSYFQTGMWVWATVLFIAMQLFLNTALGLYNALLSHVAIKEDRDRVSSLGYGLGYIGGGLILAVGLGMILAPATFGFPNTDSATRLTLAISGVWWLVFAIPLFIWVPEPPPTSMQAQRSTNAIADTFRQMGATFREIRGYSELFTMLVAFWLYSDGIGTIIQLATTYGSQQLHLPQTVLIGALLVTQFVAFPYAIMYGRFADKTSKHRSFYVAFMLWTVITFPIMGMFMARVNDGAGTTTGTTFTYLLANQVIGLVLCWFIGRRLAEPLGTSMTTKRAIVFGLAIYTVICIWGYFLNTAAEFWMLAWMVATVQGGTQALSRSMYSILTPRSKAGEFFGFYGFSDKFAGILGPLIFGVIGLATGGNLRIAILSVVIFFVLGAALLSRVDEKKGEQHAIEEDAGANFQATTP